MEILYRVCTGRRRSRGGFFFLLLFDLVNITMKKPTTGERRRERIKPRKKPFPLF
jgi:hypothetical protein